jgi:colanic acid biosynthesis glycosyl transferase WcaI
MAARLRAKGVAAERIHTDPPWSHDDEVRFDPAGRAAFRAEHGLDGKFVVMYSGNHSPCHPLDTLLEAALRLRGDDGFRFLFVGGGSEMAKVKAFRDRHGLGSILTLPYQPLERLAASLSSADLHVVVLGDAFAGIVHPCKIYNILALGLPFLAVGPPESHLNDLAVRLKVPGAAWQVRHGEVEALLRCLHEARALGFRGPQAEAVALAAEFSRGMLCDRLVALLEEAATAPRS